MKSSVRILFFFIYHIVMYGGNLNLLLKADGRFYDYLLF